MAERTGGGVGGAGDAVAVAVPLRPPTEVEDLDDDLLAGPPWSRHPADGARVLLAVVVLALTVALAQRHTADARSVAADVVTLVDQLPRWVRDLLLGITQILALVVPAGLVLVIYRRTRLLITAFGAAAVAAALMAQLQTQLDLTIPNQVLQGVERPSWIMGGAFPSGAYIAGLTAALVVVGPVLSRGWRRVAAVGLGFAIASRVITAVAVPLNLAVTVALGALIGSGALLLLGSPRRTASRREVLAALRTAGFPAEAIHAVDVGATHARTFEASTADGRTAFVKLLGRDERDADVLARLLRQLRVKDLDDTHSGWSPGDLVAHEAYTALLAAGPGVRTPAVYAAGTTSGGDGVVALELVTGTPLDQLDDDLVTDDLLDVVWDQVRILHEQGISHGWLTAAHFVVDVAAESGPSVRLIDLRWATHQADALQKGADLATLITSLALVVGAERSVAAASRAFGPDDLADALPMVQPLALPDDLRDRISGQSHLLPAVRDRLQAAAGDITYELADIERIGWSQVLSLVGGFVLLWAVLSFATHWSTISAHLRDVSLWALPGLVVLATVPYVAGAGTLTAVSPVRLPFGPTVELMFAQSFLNRFTPANAGGMALRVRYLQKRGVGLGAAGTGVALTSVASAICQVVVLVTYAVWAGSTSHGLRFKLPRADTVAVALLAVGLAAGLVWFTPWGRHLVTSRVATTLKEVWTTLRDLARQPGRFVALFVTTIVAKLAMIAAFSQSARAVGIHVSYPRLGLLYITASTVGSAAPTPGGVGAVEAALTAALTGVGVPPATALSAVFLFRLITFWLPVPFGWAAFQRSQKTILA